MPIDLVSSLYETRQLCKIPQFLYFHLYLIIHTLYWLFLFLYHFLLITNIYLNPIHNLLFLVYFLLLIQIVDFYFLDSLCLILADFIDLFLSSLFVHIGIPIFFFGFLIHLIRFLIEHLESFILDLEFIDFLVPHFDVSFNVIVQLSIARMNGTLVLYLYLDTFNVILQLLNSTLKRLLVVNLIRLEQSLITIDILSE